jgi:hypothetical protein
MAAKYRFATNVGILFEVETFSAKVEPAGRGGHFVAVPDETASALAAKHLMRVRGTLSGAPYRSNLVKMGGRLILGVHKATLATAAKDTGDEVTITIEADADPR